MRASRSVPERRRDARQKGEWGPKGVPRRACPLRVAHTCEVFFARLLARVPVPAPWAVLAEAARKPRALVHLVLGAQVQEYAVLVRALAKVREEPALRHAVPIELVQERALVALLAQPAQPVLADHLATPWVEAHARWRRRGRCIALDAKELVQIKVDAGDLHPTSAATSTILQAVPPSRKLPTGFVLTSRR